jgi:hypothetical protein
MLRRALSDKHEEELREQHAAEDAKRASALVRERKLKATVKASGLIDSFLNAMRRAGNPGLEKRDGLFSRKCWDGFIEPSGQIFVSGYPFGGAKWVWSREWLNVYLEDRTDSYGGMRHTIEGQLETLASRLASIMVKNHVRLP